MSHNASNIFEGIQSCTIMLYLFFANENEVPGWSTLTVFHHLSRFCYALRCVFICFHGADDLTQIAVRSRKFQRALDHYHSIPEEVTSRSIDGVEGRDSYNPRRCYRKRS